MIRRPKVITTSFRARPASDPPGAGKRPPLERTARPGAAASPDGWDHFSASRRREMAEHDKAVATLSDSTLLAAAKDLGKRRAHNQRDPEHRWIIARLAALARLIDKRGLNRTPALA